MNKTTPEEVLVWFVALWLTFGGGIALPFVDPPPFKTDKSIAVLVLEETAARGTYSQGQQEAMLSVDGPNSIRGYVATKQGEYLLWDKDQPATQNSPPWVAEALKVANRDKLPWIVAATPHTGFTRELPKEAAETVAALKKVGGP